MSCLSVSQSCGFLLVRVFRPELWSCWCWDGAAESFGVSWEMVGSVPGVRRCSYVTSAHLSAVWVKSRAGKCLQ